MLFWTRLGTSSDRVTHSWPYPAGQLSCRAFKMNMRVVTEHSLCLDKQTSPARGSSRHHPALAPGIGALQRPEGFPKPGCNHQSTRVRLLCSLFRNNQKCLVSFQRTVQASSSPRPPSHPHIQKEGKLAVHFSEVALLLQGVLALRIRAGKVHSRYKLP